MPDDPITPDQESFGAKLSGFAHSIRDAVMGVPRAARIPPGPCTNLRVTATTPTSISLSWAAPTVGTPPIGYTTFIRERSAANWAVGATSTTTAATVIDLKPQTTYLLEIMAHNWGAG